MAPRKTVKKDTEVETPSNTSSKESKVTKTASRKPKAAPKRKPAATKKTTATPKRKPVPKKKAAPKRKPAASKKSKEKEDDGGAASKGKRSFKLEKDSVYRVSLKGYEKINLTDALKEILKRDDFESRRVKLTEKELDASLLPKNGGKYTGRNPLQGARKCFTSISTAFTKGYWDSKTSPVILYTIKETTKGGKGKSFSYFATKRKEDEPKEIKRGSSTYFVNNNNLVKSAQRPRPKPKKEEKKKVVEEKVEAEEDVEEESEHEENNEEDSPEQEEDNEEDSLEEEDDPEEEDSLEEDEE